MNNNASTEDILEDESTASEAKLVSIVTENVNGHDIRYVFYQKENPHLSLETYDSHGPLLRVENGLGDLQDAPLAIKLNEIMKAGTVGDGIDLSPPGMKLRARDVLSSAPFSITLDPHKITVQFLQYQRFDYNSKNPRELNALYGREHNGWNGKEIEAIVTVHWIDNYGIVVEPTVKGKSFQEEYVKACQVLANDIEKQKVMMFFANLQEKVALAKRPPELANLPYINADSSNPEGELHKLAVT